MMCEITYEQLAALAQDDLPVQQRQELEQHVAGCSGCRGRLASLRVVDAALRTLPAERPSPETMLATRRLLSEETRPRREPEVLTLEEVAEFLRIDPPELRSIVDELPAFELGGQIRVRRSRLLEWIEQRERQFNRGNTASAIASVKAVALFKGVA